MSNLQDFYAILGLRSDASPDDIRQAYRTAARRLHPDVNPHPGAAIQFRDITGAHGTLSDPLARSQYDVRWQQLFASDRKYFDLKVTPSKTVLKTLAEPQVVYLLIELLPTKAVVPQAQPSSTNTPLNLTIVIDHSTSMNGVRLERTKIAAHQIIDHLSEQDILSVVAFSDRAEVLVKAAPVTERAGLKAMITPLQASGGTEILQGLTLGYQENQRYVGRRFVNHIILITDGRTYGDEEQCLNLARKAAKEGVGMSAMGIGDEWNDAFLDALASTTGGNSEYINSPNAVTRFLNDRVRSLGNSLAERVTVSLAPDPDVTIESAFRLTPTPQPISTETDPIPIGQLQFAGTTSLLLQLQLPSLPEPCSRSLIRIEVTGDIMRDQRVGYKRIADTSLDVAEEPPLEQPPLVILDALGKLTLYRMQQKAADALAQGDVREATRRLETLATRLLEAGREDLAASAATEARRVAKTQMLSEEGQKNLKYGTRMLLLSAPKDAEP